VSANFGELKTDVALALNRQNLTARIPGFINAALARINVALAEGGGITDQEQEAYATLLATDDTIEVPSDFQQLRYIRIGTDPLEHVGTFDALIDEYGDDTGPPEKYTTFAETFIFRPIPTADVTLRIGYLKSYPALTADANTNYLLTSAGNLVLYAACLEAEPWLKDDQRVQTWGQAYAQTLARLLAAATIARRGPKRADVVHDPALLAIGNGNRGNILTG
jgi:hypothetical protein